MIPRSSKLLAGLIEAKEFSAEELAVQLLVPVEMIPQYVAATMVMPLSRQMLLAKFAIARSPTQRRAGHVLQAQVMAAVGYHGKESVTHTGPRPAWTGRRRS